MIETGTKARARLDAFKKRLRDKHTVAPFSTVDDLVTSLKSDFQGLFEMREPTTADDLMQEFQRTSRALREFRLTPKRFNGTEVRLSVAFLSGPYAASRDLCKRFNLEYGSTVGMSVRIRKPEEAVEGFNELYASQKLVDTLRKLKAEKNGEIYATLLFSEGEDYEPDDGLVYILPEGKVIMLFAKSA